MPSWRGSVLIASVAVAFLARDAAAVATCDGPEICCPTKITDPLPQRQTVTVGVVLVGLYNVNERAGTWDGDFYLYERWDPLDGFTPHTEIVNEVSRQSEQFNEIQFKAGKCIRSRRLHSVLHNQYNLRRFPFDEQSLVLQLSDATYATQSLAYGDRASAAGLDDNARSALTAWKVETDPSYSHAARMFTWEDGSPSYDYADFSFRIRRHVTYHLFKFFLPLLIIVSLAFLVFWIAPEDLSSQVTIGVTCVLSAIAFQFVQQNSLPEVAYTTLADRVYVVCYLAISLALAQSVYGNALAGRSQREAALRMDKRCRWLFPVATVALLAGAVIWSFLQKT